MQPYHGQAHSRDQTVDSKRLNGFHCSATTCNYITARPTAGTKPWIQNTYGFHYQEMTRVLMGVSFWLKVVHYHVQPLHGQAHSRDQTVDSKKAAGHYQKRHQDDGVPLWFKVVHYHVQPNHGQAHSRDQTVDLKRLDGFHYQNMHQALWGFHFGSRSCTSMCNYITARPHSRHQTVDSKKATGSLPGNASSTMGISI